MIRNLKALGLALAAVFALSAAIAASASAETPGVITTDGSSVTLVGDEINGGAENYFEGAGHRTECPGSDITGHKVNVTPHEPLAAGASEVTITPVYTNCNDVVDMNGCDYRLFDATTAGGVAGTYAVKAEVVCSGTNKIKVTTSPCAAVIGPQTVTGFQLTNTAGSPDDLILSGEAPVSATACGFPITAKQRQNVTITGINPSTGAHTEITLSHN